MNSQSGDLIFGYRRKRIQATSRASFEVTAEADAKAAEQSHSGDANGVSIDSGDSADAAFVESLVVIEGALLMRGMSARSMEYQH